MAKRKPITSKPRIKNKTKAKAQSKPAAKRDRSIPREHWYKRGSEFTLCGQLRNGIVSRQLNKRQKAKYAQSEAGCKICQKTIVYQKCGA